MQFVSSLKEMSRRRLWVAAGVILALMLAVLVVFQVHSIFPPVLKSRVTTVWVANTQVLVDAQSSAIANLNQGLDPLVPRAGVYANLMTSEALVNAIAQAAKIPASEISVAGPIGTNGQRPQHGATSLAPQTPPGYSLQLNTDETQPLIRITAQAPTSQTAAALANGAATGLTTYVTQLETAQQVPPKHRVDLRQLGQPAPSATASGIAPALFIPIYIVLLTLWCMLVLFASRFAEAWRQDPPATRFADTWAQDPPAPGFEAWSQDPPAGLWQDDWSQTDMPGYHDELSAHPPPQPEPADAHR